MPAMELTILGSGTAVPSLARAAPGYLLRVGRDIVVLDGGSGTLVRLLEAGVRHDQVSHLLYSHHHLDHCGELAPWLFTSNIPASARTTPLTIIGSAGFMSMLASLRSLYGRWLDARTYTLTLATMSPATAPAAPLLAFEGWSVRAFPVNHIDASLAYRITDDAGRVFAYTGDTGMSEGLVDLARDADLLLIDASTPDGMSIEGHLTPSEAGDIARRAGARRVVLTHFYPACDGIDMLAQLRRVYTGEAFAAEDGMRFTV